MEPDVKLCALVAGRSFLSRCWPENSLLGFVARQHVFRRLFFVPPPWAGSVLGGERRLLTSIVDGLRDSQSLKPLTARRGLLLVLLSSENLVFEFIRLAVCDPIGRACHLLPPLIERRVHNVSCTVLTAADECYSSSEGQHQRYLNSFFRVLAITFFANEDAQVCNLYIFSSAESHWSAPIEIHQLRQRCFQFPANNAVCGAMAHWLVPCTCFSDDGEKTLKYYTLDVSAETGHISLTEISIPTNQFHTTYLDNSPKLGVTADGSLSLFCLQDEPTLRLHMWKRGNHAAWFHTRVIELNPLTQQKLFWDVQLLPLEKSNKFLFIDESECMDMIDLEAGAVEDKHRFQHDLGSSVIPMTIEWPTLFVSRLG
jgi:hypothetical protein